MLVTQMFTAGDTMWQRQGFNKAELVDFICPRSSFVAVEKPKFLLKTY